MGLIANASAAGSQMGDMSALWLRGMFWIRLVFRHGLQPVLTRVRDGTGHAWLSTSGALVALMASANAEFTRWLLPLGIQALVINDAGLINIAL